MRSSLKFIVAVAVFVCAGCPSTPVQTKAITWHAPDELSSAMEKFSDWIERHPILADYVISVGVEDRIEFYEVYVGVRGNTGEYLSLLSNYSQNSDIDLDVLILTKWAHASGSSASESMLLVSSEMPCDVSVGLRNRSLDPWPELWPTDYQPRVAAFERYKHPNGACFPTISPSYEFDPATLSAAAERASELHPAYNTGRTLAPIVDAVHRFYGDAGAKARIDTIDTLFAQISVDNIRGLVISGTPQRWEKLQLAFFATPGADDSVEIRVIIDGQWATGLGNQPSLSDYKDMSPRYESDLINHRNVLMDSVTKMVTNDAGA